MEKKRIRPGYKAGSTTKELANTLGFRLWELLRDQASPETLELLAMHDAMTSIFLGVGEEDSLADPLGSIVEVLQFLDGKSESPDCANAT